MQGVAPLRYSYEDVSRPVVDPINVCDGTTDGPDGYLDLVFHFKVQDILARLPGWASVDVAEQLSTPESSPYLGLQHLAFLPVAGEAPPGKEYVLTLIGDLWGGIPIKGQDCIILLDTVDVPDLR